MPDLTFEEEQELEEIKAWAAGLTSGTSLADRVKLLVKAWTHEKDRADRAENALERSYGSKRFGPRRR